jgi:hypothetical protein
MRSDSAWGSRDRKERLMMINFGMYGLVKKIYERLQKDQGLRMFISAYYSQSLAHLALEAADIPVLK